MPRAFLLVLLLALASAVRADDVSEAALAGRWKVVGTAPTAKNRDGLAELEKHGCYLYFEFAANGRAAVGIGSDSKAKLAALKKANPDVELEWAAKFVVANGRVEISGFPAHLREPGGWLGDSATAIFRTRLDGDTLELTGPGGFVAFQKVKKQVAGGALGTKVNPKTGADALVGRWRFTKLADSRTDFPMLYERAKLYFYYEFAPNGTVTFATHSDDPNRPTLKSKAGPLSAKGKYRVGPDNALELYEMERVGGLAGLNLDNPKYSFAVDGDALVLTEGGARKLECVRVATPVHALVGAWRIVDSTKFTKQIRDQLARAEMYNVTIYGADGTVRMGLRSRDGKPQPVPQQLERYVWKYRVLSETELEVFDLPPAFRPDFLGPEGGNTTAVVKYSLKGDTLTTVVPGTTDTLTYARDK